MSAIADPVRVTLRYRGLVMDRVEVRDVGSSQMIADTASGVARVRAIVSDPRHHPILFVVADALVVRLDTRDVDLVAVHSVHDVPAGGLFEGHRAQQGESLAETGKPELHQRDVIAGGLQRETAAVDPRDLTRREGR